ncbi:class A beta-lactamase [Edaphobacter aggregans]|uniref:class A beta-lactamase n=1 Tax=Edaphobacter aggregans TaxID=570835 RepID=UPI0005594BBB|nr:class A beta-lactamase [Edaphobacter aggregans]
MVTRRTAIIAIAAAAASPRALLAQTGDLAATLAALEQKSKGRLGVAILFPDGRRATYRADERFPMCSTFKFLAAALTLQRVDQNKERLNRTITYSKSDLVTYSPETEKHTSMTVASLCQASLTLSDNTAANLLLASFGGPPAITAFARSLGDPVTRLDRTETTLNESTPGDPRDTTTPTAMLANLQKILFGNVLKPASRDHLTRWMLANTTGKAKFVAGLPATWKVADKTGSGDHGSNNDIGVLYPPGDTAKPILITSYLTETTITTDERNAIHADVARSITQNLDKPR